MIKAELSELNYPYETENRSIVIPINAEFSIKVAQQLAEALIYIGSIGGGVVIVKKVIDKVKTIFKSTQNTRTINCVLLFLIGRFVKNGSGATVNELSLATHRSKSSIRKVLQTLQLKKLAYKSQGCFGKENVWYYSRPKKQV